MATEHIVAGRPPQKGQEVTVSSLNLTQVGGAPFALGQQLAVSSLPIVLTAAQIATLTPFSGTVPTPSATSTGLTPYNNTALSSTKQTVKASTGNLYGYHIFNPGTATVYIQVFNKLAANVTVGTTVPDWVYAIPATATSPAGLDGMFAIPITFSIGMVIAATTTSTGSTAPGTALLANFFYL